MSSLYPRTSLWTWYLEKCLKSIRGTRDITTTCETKTRDVRRHCDLEIYIKVLRESIRVAQGVTSVTLESMLSDLDLYLGSEKFSKVAIGIWEEEDSDLLASYISIKISSVETINVSR